MGGGDTVLVSANLKSLTEIGKPVPVSEPKTEPIEEPNEEDGKE